MKANYILFWICFGMSLIGCDMHHIVNIEPILHEEPESLSKNLESFSYDKVKYALAPVFKENLLSCNETTEGHSKRLKCKTWALSTTELQLIDKDGKTILFVQDSLPVIWTPQPYGRVSKQVKAIIIKNFGIDNTECRYGFGLFGTCDEWKKE
jgi:hypothetical protein